MANVNWTDAQNDFINAPRGPILVSAAAGSGKTAAIVERVCRRLADRENPLLANKLLMTTFTKAAAGEMQTRIEKSLYEKIEEDSENEYLINQYDNLSNAQIGTIHSLCFKILRENFSKAGILCDFRVADETDIDLLKLECADEVVNDAYESKGDNFTKLVELVCDYRKDDAIKKLILDIYNSLIAMPFPKDELKKWLEYSRPTDESYKQKAEIIANECVKSLELAEKILLNSLSCLDDEGRIKIVSDDVLSVKEAITKTRELNFYEASAITSGLKFANNGKMSRVDPSVKKEREYARKLMQDVTDILEYSDRDSFIADQTLVFPQIECLFSLVEEFMDVFASRKREKNILDFNDAEQMVLNLLFEKQNGKYVKTELAKALSLRYDEIYIDEYQDINSAQDMIFNGISRDNNVFMVGDVKQSIYRFRQSDPDIFKAKRNAYNLYDKKNFPAKIFFEENFRSREEITSFVNNIFENIMTEETCGSTYGDGERLVSRGKFPQNSDAGVQMLFYDCPPGTLADEETETEAEIVANTIYRMVSQGYLVIDKNGLRPCRYGDFCIMLRADKGRFDIFSKALSDLEIESVRENKDGGFLDAREILMLRSVLKTINNPYDDVSLGAAMLSPIFAFSPNDLAVIRADNKYKKSLFDAVKDSANEGNQKAENFIAALRNLQRLAACQSVDNLLSYIYNRHGFYNMVAAMNGGEIRTANLDLMRYYSRTFEQNGYRGLSEFTRFIEKLCDNKKDFKKASAEGENLNAVKIMTIHKSKGLEFPICILSKSAMDLREDNRSPSILNKDFGFAVKIRDSASSIVYKPFSFRFLKFIEKQKMIEESMRLLYVALTRAKEKLIIPVVKKNIAASIDEAILNSSDDKMVSSVKTSLSFLDWILLSTVKSKALTGVCSAFSEEEYTVNDYNGFSAEIIRDEEGLEAEEKEQDEISADPTLVKCLNETSMFKYPYLSQSSVVSKFSVSEIAKGEKETIYDFEALPEFMKGEHLSGAERGTALHTFMQFANLENAQKDIQAEIERVYNNGHLSDAQVSVIETEKIKTFLNSSLYERIKKADKVYKEYKFMTGVDSSNFGGERTANDVVIIQGVSDCVLIEGDKAAIIDYKTDYVKDESTLIDRYTMQLSIYRGAIEKMLAIPVTECIIYSFSLGKEIKIEPDNSMF